jgi:uncharacterized phage protein (TIGR01671 family)
MREIKIRAYAVEEMVNSQWLYGFGVSSLEFTEEFAKQIGRKRDWWLYTEQGDYRVYEKSIGQYTGKKDSYNTEIFEGDILGCESNGVNRYEKRVVCWDSYQAKFKSVPLSTYHSNAGNGGWTGYDLYRTNCEVLGNIYEHPDLL